MGCYFAFQCGDCVISGGIFTLLVQNVDRNVSLIFANWFKTTSGLLQFLKKHIVCLSFKGDKNIPLFYIYSEKANKDL